MAAGGGGWRRELGTAVENSAKGFHSAVSDFRTFICNYLFCRERERIISIVLFCL